MDVCLETYEYEKAFEVVDLDTVHSLLQLDALADDTDIFDMTSLSTLMLLGQNETKLMSLNDTELDEEHNCEKYRLSLAYEKLYTMPKLLINELAPVIRILDISNNVFDNVHFLSEFKQLKILICDRNNISSTTHIPHMPQLELLWMNNCKIQELYPWATRLHKACPNLKQLSLMGNPAAPSYLNGGTFYEYLQYRLFMISLFSTLVHLDDKPVTNDQRKEAYRMYRRPLFERLTSKAPATVPVYLRSVTDKVTEIFCTVPNFGIPRKNCII